MLVSASCALVPPHRFIFRTINRIGMIADRHWLTLKDPPSGAIGTTEICYTTSGAWQHLQDLDNSNSV